MPQNPNINLSETPLSFFHGPGLTDCGLQTGEGGKVLAAESLINRGIISSFKSL